MKTTIRWIYFIHTRQVFAHLCLLHVFILVLNPHFSDIIKAAPFHDVKGNEQNVCAKVGQEPDIPIDLLSGCVANPENINVSLKSRRLDFEKKTFC